MAELAGMLVVAEQRGGLFGGEGRRRGRGDFEAAGRQDEAGAAVARGMPVGVLYFQAVGLAALAPCNSTAVVAGVGVPELSRERGDEVVAALDLEARRDRRREDTVAVRVENDELALAVEAVVDKVLLAPCYAVELERFGFSVSAGAGG